MRIGIELSSVACRIVELGAEGPWRRDRSTRVVALRSWGSASGSAPVVGAPEAAARLAPFRGRRASVVLWSMRSDHRQVVVRAASYDRMRTEARARLAEAGLSLDGRLSDIAPASPRESEPDRRVVVLASAPGAEVAAALAPLVAAGITIESVLTPAAALQSLARLRTESLSPAPVAGLEAYIALEETATCIAFLRDGALVAAHHLPWGFLDELSDFQTPRERYDVAVRLADELGEIVSDAGAGPLAQVVVCGGMPELRSMTVQLMDRLDVEVEPLDSLFGIDESRVPGSADEFHDAVAGIRMAWAAAANAKPALDLFRHRRRQVLKGHLSRAAVVAGAAAGLGLGWWGQQEWPAAPSAAVASPARAVRGFSAAHIAETETVDATEVAPETPRPLESRSIVVPSPMLMAAVIPTPISFSLSASVESAPVPAPARAAAAPSSSRPWENVPPLAAPPHAMALLTTQPPDLKVRPTYTVPPPAVAPAIAQPPDRVKVRPTYEAPVAVAIRTAPRPAAEAATAFDAGLQTILYGPDRSLAIVDGRIVQVGDDIRGARILEITANTVLLRDGQGKLRRLTLSGH